MRTRLFPILDVSACSCGDYEDHPFPRAREAALRKALTESAILNSDWPSHLPDFLRKYRGRIRVMPNVSRSVVAEPLEDLDQWEQVLGGPVAAEVAEHGQEVDDQLLPCFLANHHLLVVDPYLAPGDCKCQSAPCSCRSESRRDKDLTVEALLERAARPGESEIEILEVATSTRRWKESPQEADAVAIGRWLLEYASTRIGPSSPLSSLTWRLFPRQPARVHDRFLGFSTQGRRGAPPGNSDPPWHALTIGYGVRALRRDSAGQTCVARVSETQFKSVLERAERHFLWGVVVQQGSCTEDPPSGWRELRGHRAASSDWSLQVLRKIQPGEGV